MSETKNTNDDLEYLSKLGYDKFPLGTGDLEDLGERIEKRKVSKNSLFYTGILSLVLGIILGLTFFYVFYSTPSEILHNLPVNKNDSLEQTNLEIPTYQLEEVLHEGDNFIRKGIERPVIAHSDTAVQESAHFEALQIQSIPLTVIKEEKIKFVMNSPVVYIHDLKVTDYVMLYFRKNRFLAMSGVPAKYSNIKEEAGSETHLKQEPSFFLHEELARALYFYKKGQYDQCVILLNTVRTYNEEDINCAFYSGMSYFHLKKFESALHQLNECLESKNNVFVQEASYYKALCLLGLGMEKEARDLLTLIANEGEFYSEKAREHLR